MIQPHSRTLSVIRSLRVMGPLKKRRRMPRQAQPDGVRREYFAALQPVIHQATSAFASVKHAIIGLLVSERQAQKKDARQDASRRQQALDLINKAAARAADAFDPKGLRKIATKFGLRTSAFQKEQLGRQLVAEIGVPLSAIERPILNKLEGFAALNVDLIKTVPERYFDRLRQDVTEAFDSGMHPSTLADLFVERDGMAENDARRIARDQIGKLNGQLNEERQKGMGVTGYIWRTSNDNRVRDEHTEREGQHFEWNSPPEDGHPGEPIQCRCFAEPDLGPILEGLGEG